MTGLLEALSNDYLRSRPTPGSIQWICNHSRNTQIALLQRAIDIALTYERDQEHLASEEGWSKTIACVFHDHFILAGPVDDPAGIGRTSSLAEAFAAIAQRRCLFHSRADFSATMWKERSLWEQTAATKTPWESSSAAEWYKQSHLSPPEALVAASKARAYLLTDRSTLLAQTRLRKLDSTNLTVYFEPDSAESELMNSCYALISPDTADGPDDQPARDNHERDAFIDYLVSARGQDVIGSFGKVNSTDVPFFARATDGYARQPLRGGTPVGGTWRGPEAKLA